MKNIPAQAWVVVADGTGARQFLNIGKGATVSLMQQKVMIADEQAGSGPSGHRPPESSMQATEEATFAKQLARYLNAAALKQEFTDLVLIADPQTLGQLRPQLHLETSQRIIREIAKTFTNSPLEDIQTALNQ
ncbi:MAG: host attachment family protein [Arenimonas sp.]